MNVLYHAPSLGGHGAARRMSVAVEGLLLRGHSVHRLGSSTHEASRPAWLRWLGDVLEAGRLGGRQVIVGGLGSRGAIAAGCAARAECAVLAASAEELAASSAHYASPPLPTWFLVEENEAEKLGQAPTGLPLEQVALWSRAGAAEAPSAEHPDTEILERACERARARARRRSPAPAVFFDRDGTLIREMGYLADARDVELLPGVPSALHALRAAGLPVVVVSNQSGVGRGYFPLERVYQVNARVRELLERQGVELDAVYFCPHRPDEGCPCRKPRPGLLERAREDLLLDLRNSIVVGDKLLDVATAQAVGARGVLVRSGYGREEEQRLGAAELRRPPDFVGDDLRSAGRWILSRSGD